MLSRRDGHDKLYVSFKRDTMCGCNKSRAAGPSIRPAAVAAAPRARTNVRSSVAKPSVTITVDPVIPTVDTSIWGPSLWKALHIASVFSQNLPLWRELTDALVNDLPCPDCRAHFHGWLRTHSLQSPAAIRSIMPIKRMLARFQKPQTITPPDILRWILDLHNNVNSRTGRAVWSEQQVRDSYGGDRSVRIAEGRAALESLRGIIGSRAFDLLMRILV
jgi:hypothetical protein